MNNKKFLNFDKVLCLSPHPDDVEYSMSGAAITYGDTKFDIFCLTTGTSTDHTSTSKRFDESRTFWNNLSLDNVECFFNHDRQNFGSLSEAQWLTKIENMFDLKEYDAIFCTPSEDSHFEHQLCNRLMIALGRSRSISLIEYRSPSTLHSWVPNLFVDVEKQFTTKVSCLIESFESQADSRYFSNYCIELFHSNFTECKKDLLRFESFKTIVYYC